MKDKTVASTPTDHMRTCDFSTNRWCRDQCARRVVLQATASIRTNLMLFGELALSRGEQGRQFLHLATRAVRRMLVDQARVEHAAHCIGIDMPDADGVPHEAWEGLLKLDAMLDRLERADPRQAAIVEYRLFSYLPFEDIARMLDVNTKAAVHEWRMARAWLRRVERDSAKGQA